MSNDKLSKIYEELSTLTVIEMSELTSLLKDKWNLSDMAFAAAAPAGGSGNVAAEKSDFDVMLVSFGESKMSVIKVVKELTGLSLTEAKDLVDKAPSKIKEKASKADAEDIKSKLEAAGAKVELK